MISATNDKKDDRSSEDDENKIMRKGVKIMDKLEKVEKLREKTGVSYEDAKNALEACDYDLLDAIIYLEKLDKVKAPEVESFTTGAEQQTSTEFEQAQQKYTNDCNKVTFGQMFQMVRQGVKEECGQHIHSRTQRPDHDKRSGSGACDRTHTCILGSASTSCCRSLL